MHMPHWLSLIAAVLAGAVAAGTAFYIVGRRLLSRAAAVAATERERLLEEARQRLTLAAKEELIQAREALRSEEHTSELQSPCNLVCRLLLEKKKNKLTHLRPQQ